MRSRMFTIGGAVLAAAALVIGIDGATYAATGNSLVLGRSNTAGTTTVIGSTSGPVLDLRPGNATDAPFVSSGSGRVTNLNADRLDSLDASQFQRRLTAMCGSHQALVGVWASGAPSCRNAEPTTLIASVPDVGAADVPVASRLDSVPPGHYRAQLSAALVPTVRGTPSAPKTATCQLQSGATVLASVSGADVGGALGASLNGSAVIAVPQSGLLDVVCGFGQGTWSFAKANPATIALTPLPFTQAIGVTTTGPAALR